MEKELDFCIICTSNVHSSRKLMDVNGAVKRERVDNGHIEFITADDDEHLDLAFEDQDLTPLFVLKNIFNVPTETLELLNYGVQNNQDPLARGSEVQVPLCPPCSALGRQFHEIFEQVSRLQMTLNGIEAEFMEKFQQNKRVQCQGSSSIWTQIRRQVVLTSVGDDCLQNTHEEPDNFGEEWHHGKVMIKAEVVEEPVDDDDEDEVGVPAFPMSSTILHSTSTLNYDVDNENSSCVPSPPKKRKASVSQDATHSKTKAKLYPKRWVQCPRCPYHTQDAKRMATHHAPLHEEGSQGIPCDDCGWYIATDMITRHRARFHYIPRTIRKTIKKTAQPAPDELLQCEHCPHKTTNLQTYSDHQQVHMEGSGGKACSECAIFVLPSTLGRHRKYCESVIRNSLGRDEKLSSSESKRKRRDINASNANYVCFKRGFIKRVQYGCRQCPYETLERVRMRIHAELHEEGAQADACGECGWFLPSEQMETHRAVNHSRTEKSSGHTPVAAATLKCGECSFECNSKRRKQFDFHVKGHQREEIKCEDCGCHLSRRQLSYHRSKYCLVRSKESEVSVNLKIGF